VIKNCQVGNGRGGTCEKAPIQDVPIQETFLEIELEGVRRPPAKPLDIITKHAVIRGVLGGTPSEAMPGEFVPVREFECPQAVSKD